MRLIFLTHYYPPEVGAPQARIAALAAGLRDRGLEVTVHTGFPNYPGGSIRAPYRNRPWLVESEGGMRVVRTAVLPAPNRGFAMRLANHAAFAVGALVLSPLAGRADAVVVETPPLFLAGAAIGYAQAKRAPLVVHVSDLWPDSAVALGALRRPGPIALARALERACYRSADAIVCPTAGIEATLSGRPEAGSKVRRIPPGVDTERFAPRDSTAARGERPFRVLYAGTLGMSQGLETLIDAAALIDGREPIEISIAGDGAEAPLLRARLERAAPANVRMLGVVPHERMPDLYEDADAAVVLLRDRALFRGALPTKMLEAMSASRPIVLSAAGEAADLVRETGCGVVVPPERPAELASGLADLARNRRRAQRMGSAGRRTVVERYSRGRALDDWLAVLRAVTISE